MTLGSTASGHTEAEFDVVVVGGGPVGKMAALMLGRRGHSVLVLERKEETYPLPRAVAHDAEIARLLQSVGMPVDSIPDAIEPYDDLYVWVNAAGETLHLVDWRGYDTSGWNNTYFYNQPAVERHLEAELENCTGVTMRRGSVATVGAQDESGVTVTSGDQTYRARYVVAADGANSATRRHVGIEWTDLGYFFDWLVVDVIPGADMEELTIAKQVADPVRPVTVVPAGPGRRRWEFMRLEGETNDELTDPDRIWQLLEPFGVHPDNAQIERGVVYTFASGWASSFRQGRVLLAGDAAHLMPPFAGQGLAAGLRDCMNLSWKLDLVLRGVLDDEVLDTYGSERSAHVSDFIDFSIMLGKIICILDPDEAAQRDAAMIAELASGREPEPPPRPRLGAGLYRGDQGGYLSWQGRIDVEDRTDVRFDDVFGAAALIIRDREDAESLSGEQIGRLNQLGITVTCFDDAFAGAEGVQAFGDARGTYAEWFTSIDADAVLVRPDLYVFAAESGPGAAPRLADAYSSAVGAPASVSQASS
ncbi:bifunctional 3-(3-hydroxy-phenyl)propionate/3-hydroxycinnamic acid hydroxylase [Aeromicrobium sp.]|uniref:bifunctional 3-(3-hydroxy-phenyl)propionate/3-hydroxycinnamic acid hydroxylase MhpA n=1 Tax=Aeromicrobium sp. TaxID=1871063 RepID=UPI0030C0248D